MNESILTRGLAATSPSDCLLQQDGTLFLNIGHSLAGLRRFRGVIITRILFAAAGSASLDASLQAEPASRDRGGVEESTKEGHHSDGDIDSSKSRRAFYTPQGYGAVATGGSEDFHVTNLDDSGQGSLRDAFSASGRRVVFDLSGTITITSTLVIPSNTTIDGTTAHGVGITVTGFNTSMSNSRNIIIKNMRFREDVTGPRGKTSLQGAPCDTVMIDHCSIEWGRWDCMEFTNGSHDITIQNCIIGQSIDPQHFGCLINDCDRISIHHNLWIGNNNRNPKLKGNCQYINNVIYNWGSAGGLQGGHSSAPWKSDLLGNYFIKGPSSGNDRWATDCSANDQWFTSGNFLDLDNNGSLNGSRITTAQYDALGVTLLTSPQHSPSTPVTVDSAKVTVKKAVAGNYGCQPLDPYDATEIGFLRSYGTMGKIGK